jgi:hypothetical protein
MLIQSLLVTRGRYSLTRVRESVDATSQTSITISISLNLISRHEGVLYEFWFLVLIFSRETEISIL